MSFKLRDYQSKAVKELKSGSILCGGVGSGKSATAIAYYHDFHGGRLEPEFECMKKPRDLYIITTAKKRDSLEWDKEMIPFLLSTDDKLSQAKVTIDSWNNIKKYKSIIGAFFIFDEQRLVGSGRWVKSFLKMAQRNKWIILSATPGDTWIDYIPVLVANRFYKNRKEFLDRHAVYSRYTKYPKIDRILEVGHLSRLRDNITVVMDYLSVATQKHEWITTNFNKKDMDTIIKKRWNLYKKKPIESIAELCYLMRKVSNSHPDRIKETKKLLTKHERVIIFYNFDYELEDLRKMCHDVKISFSEWNGHNHDELPKGKKWVYLVQYTAGAEGWNCTKTDTIIFYSQTYSYKSLIQSAGRTDRLNSKYKTLYYYHLESKSEIDKAIKKALKSKKNFNIRKMASKLDGI